MKREKILAGTRIYINNNLTKEQMAQERKLRGTLVTVPLSNNGAKTAAKSSRTCPITLPSVSSFTFIAALLYNCGLLSQKSFLQVHQLEKHGSLSHCSVSNRLVHSSIWLSFYSYRQISLDIMRMRIQTYRPRAARGVVLALYI